MMDKANKSLIIKTIVYMLFFGLMIASAALLRCSAEVLPTEYVVIISKHPTYNQVRVHYGLWTQAGDSHITTAQGVVNSYVLTSGALYGTESIAIIQIDNTEYSNAAFEIITSSIPSDVWTVVGLDEYYEATDTTSFFKTAYAVGDVSVSPTPTPTPTNTPTPTPTNTPILTATSTPKPTPTNIPLTNEEKQLSWFFDMVMTFFMIEITVLGYNFTFFQLFIYVIIAGVLMRLIYSIGR